MQVPCVRSSLELCGGKGAHPIGLDKSSMLPGVMTGRSLLSSEVPVKQVTLADHAEECISWLPSLT